MDNCSFEFKPVTKKSNKAMCLISKSKAEVAGTDVKGNDFWAKILINFSMIGLC